MENDFIDPTSGFDWVHGGDLIAKQLKEEGVKHLFTLTGGHISGIYDGARFQNIKLIDFRHEQAAVHAADAYARLTRSPSAAALTAGPGVTNGISGIATAFYSCSPVVVLGGRNPFSLGNHGNLQDAPHIGLTTQITKYSSGIYDSWRSCHIVREAFASALSPRYGPAYIDVPMDVQLTRMHLDDAPPVRKKTNTLVSGPDPLLVKLAAKMLAKAKKPVVIAGSGVYWDRAEQALAEFSSILELPIYVNGMARGILAKSDSNQVFSNRKKTLLTADLIILLGTDLDFRFGYGQPGSINAFAELIQVDSESSVIGKHRDVTLGIASNIALFLTELITQANIFHSPSPNKYLSELKLIDHKITENNKVSYKSPDSPIHPMRFVQEVISFLDDDAIVIGDGGDIVAMFAEVYRCSRPGHWMDPGPFGCLGIGVPFAIGARLAKPDKQILVISGDGSFGFNGFEFDSAVRQNIPFVLIIGNDGAWGEMRTFHEDVFGPADTSAQYLSQKTQYETVVNGLGGYGQKVTVASEIVPALKRAFDSGVPSVINVILDPTYRREAQTISAKHMVMAYGEGDLDAFKRSI
ncbi:thiamine pyrophosphate-binding protein [Pedobacter sp. V48]|uniref:thiamine pyrophosphate-binding protein n=1 Tax=Pedobacter sp. V48 TaxID=509635 RepID=UPI0003E4FF7C|nr:thiamine pyrophosphate-binding protein [Pedobacter sp. V48]ETZ22832.1 hypothetical protein N824_21320 [Pedobacter sp. V48]